MTSHAFKPPKEHWPAEENECSASVASVGTGLPVGLVMAALMLPFNCTAGRLATFTVPDTGTVLATLTFPLTGTGLAELFVTVTTTVSELVRLKPFCPFLLSCFASYRRFSNLQIFAANGQDSFLLCSYFSVCFQ
jgi:hypothetical protein